MLVIGSSTLHVFFMRMQSLGGKNYALLNYSCLHESMSWELLLSLFFRWENWDSGRWSNLLSTPRKTPGLVIGWVLVKIKFIVEQALTLWPGPFPLCTPYTPTLPARQSGLQFATQTMHIHFLHIVSFWKSSELCSPGLPSTCSLKFIQASLHPFTAPLPPPQAWSGCSSTPPTLCWLPPVPQHLRGPPCPCLSPAWSRALVCSLLGPEASQTPQDGFAGWIKADSCLMVSLPAEPGLVAASGCWVPPVGLPGS